MSDIATGAGLVVVAYLFGGIPVGVVVAAARNVDLRRLGSGNIGASNVLRTLGTKAGLAVCLADVSKGLLPVLWSRTLLAQAIPTSPGEPWLALIALSTAIGHCFSPYLRLAGGRGVSTSLGALLAIDWRASLGVFAVWIIVMAFTRYISLGSVLGAASAPGFLALWADSPYYWALGVAFAILIVERHRSNIGRLLAGTERRIGEKAQRPPADTDE